MKRLLLLALVAIATMTALATAQFSERIAYNGRMIGMHSLPLDQHPLSDSIYARMPSGLISTALYRNYQGYWSIRNDSLFLDSIGLPESDGLHKYDLTEVLGRPLPVFASWVTDTLHLIDGKCVFYVHDAWMSRFEKDIYLEVTEGKVKLLRTVENEVINRELQQSQMLALLTEFANENCPWLEKGKRIVVQATYTEVDSARRPSKTEIKIVRLPKGTNISEQQLQEFTEKLGQFLIDKKMMTAAWVDGKILCYWWTFHIKKPDD